MQTKSTKSYDEKSSKSEGEKSTKSESSENTSDINTTECNSSTTTTAASEVATTQVNVPREGLLNNSDMVKSITSSTSMSSSITEATQVLVLKLNARNKIKSDRNEMSTKNVKSSRKPNINSFLIRSLKSILQK